MSSHHWFEEEFNNTLSPEDIVIHESAYIDEPCQIGMGTHIKHFSHVMANSVIGNHCEIGPSATISSGVIVGNNVKVLNNALLHSGIIIEDDVYCGPSAVFTELKHVRADAGNISTIQPTLIRRGANIGANVTIAAGFTIGQYAFVESGSVIDQHVPDFAMVHGQGTLHIAGWRCECGLVLDFVFDTTTCTGCNKRYERYSEKKVMLLPTT